MSDRILTTSSARVYRACPRLYRFRYVDGYRPIRTEGPRAFGHLIHVGLGAWFSVSTQRLDVAWKAMQCVDADPWDLAAAQELLRGYEYRWADESMSALAIEQAFDTSLRNPNTEAASRTFRLAGKIDAVVEYRGQLWLMEHKTSSEDITPGSTYWQKLRLDTQISTYFVGAEALGHQIIGCIYDVIGKPRLRPLTATPSEKRKYKKDGTLYANQREYDEGLDEYRARLRNDIAENPDKYYQRGEVYRLQNEEIEAAFDMWQTGKAILESTNADRWPRNTDSCFKYNRPCDFWPVCAGEAGLDDEFRYKKLENAHEELEANNDNANAEQQQQAIPDIPAF